MRRYRWIAVGVLVLSGVGYLNIHRLRRPPRPTFREIVKNRAAPDLGTLADRSAPGRQGSDATEALYDLLALRDHPKATAVPALDRILASHACSRHVHGYAAAQALFCVGTPEAHDILARHLLVPTYSAYDGIRYAFYYEMPAPQRDEFIARYHLQNLTPDVSVLLSVVETGKPSLVFTVTVRNISDRTLRFPDRPHYVGSMLYFQSENGSYVRGEMTGVEFKSLPPKWIDVTPGGEWHWRIEASAKSTRELKGPYPGLSDASRMVVETNDWYFDVGQAGKFQVAALIEETAPCGAEAKATIPDGRFFGRAVSNPVAVSVGQ